MDATDGGPAFPHDAPAWACCPRCGCGSARTGMSLRDWFAGQALSGLIASNDAEAGDRIAGLPGYAYDIADAMLAARARK